MRSSRCRVDSASRAGAVLAAMLLLASWLQSSTGAPAAAGADDAEGATDAVGTDGIAGTGASTGTGYLQPDPVAGSGILATRLIMIEGITSVVAESGFSVHVTTGEPERATIRADENLVDLVETQWDGHRLRLGLRPGAAIRDATLSAELTVRSLDQVTASNASQVTFDSGLAADDLLLAVLGTSEISGTIRAERVQAGVSGASRLVLAGQADRVGVAASGASELMLAELTVADLDARLSGASVADITVNDTLAAEISGASTLRYRGVPRIVRRQTSGASSIGPVGW